jgi:putative restriction endonuclease
LGGLFLFKLHSPLDYSVGGGFFSHWTKLPVSYAWEAFEVKDGASSLPEMRARIERYRRTKPEQHEDYNIGCILLLQPFFFSREAWLKVPDWNSNIVRGKTYDFTQEPGTTLWHEVQQQLQGMHVHLRESERRYGEPALVKPRFGQGSFRVIVADAYKRQCAVTGGKALPVLIAAHIRPFGEGGDHRVDNGVLLRSDIHTLFDRGYVTITPEYRVKISKRLRADF